MLRGASLVETLFGWHTEVHDHIIRLVALCRRNAVSYIVCSLQNNYSLSTANFGNSNLSLTQLQLTPRSILFI
jgi:hypothetical protein